MSLILQIEEYIKDQIEANMGTGSDYGDELVVQEVACLNLRRPRDWHALQMPAVVIDSRTALRQAGPHHGGKLNFTKTYPVICWLIADGDLDAARRRARELDARFEKIIRSWVRVNLTDDETGEILERLTVSDTAYTLVRADSTTTARRHFGVAAMGLTFTGKLAGPIP